MWERCAPWPAFAARPARTRWWWSYLVVAVIRPDAFDRRSGGGRVDGDGDRGGSLAVDLRRTQEPQHDTNDTDDTNRKGESDVTMAVPPCLM